MSELVQRSHAGHYVLQPERDVELAAIRRNLRNLRLEEGRLTTAPHLAVTGDDEFGLRDLGLLIVDDCTLHRDNLATVFTAIGVAQPSYAWDLTSLFNALNEYQADVALINVNTRDSSMLVRATFEISPTVKVIVLGIAEDDEEHIVSFAEAGVAGYHSRNESLDGLLRLIRNVADGGTSCPPNVSAILLRRLSELAAQRQPASKELVLTAREIQILRMLEMGLSNKDIGERLCIAVHTVKNHVHNLLNKLGVRTRSEAAAYLRNSRYFEIDRKN